MADKPALRLVYSSDTVEDQVVRQERFARAHPEVSFYMTVNHYYGAYVPGRPLIIRLHLEWLLNALDELYPES